MITVRAGKIGGRATELFLNDGALLREAKKAYGENLGNLQARVNNAVVADDYELEDGDVVTFVQDKEIQGGR